MIGWPYKVVRHETARDEGPETMLKVVVRCLGYPTHGPQPSEWEFSFLIPKDRADEFAIDAHVRLEVK